MNLFVSICDTNCVTNRDTFSDHFNHQARACHLFTHRWPYGKNTFCLFWFCVCSRLHVVDNTNYHSSSNRIYTSGGDGSALQILNTQQTYQPAGFLHSSDIVRLVCSVLLLLLYVCCELRYRCVQPTVLCYGRESPYTTVVHCCLQSTAVGKHYRRSGWWTNGNREHLLQQ